MKKTLFTLLTFLSIHVVYSQTDTTWHKGGRYALNFTQVSFSNWAAGGENSLGGNSLVSVYAHYKRGKRIWDTNLDLAYGLMQLNGQNVRKTDDKIDFLTKYGYSFAKELYFSTNFNFKTQFANGFNYPNDSVIVSTFLSPAYIQLGVGIDYKPRDYFSLSFLPLTGRVTIVADERLAAKGAYGVEPGVIDENGNIIVKGKSSRLEVGAALIAMFQKEIFTNITFRSKVQLFSNYLKNPQAIDINMDSHLSLKVNKFISTYVGAILIYDEDIPVKLKDGTTGPRTQFKQTFGMGLAVEF